MKSRRGSRGATAKPPKAPKAVGTAPPTARSAPRPRRAAKAAPTGATLIACEKVWRAVASIPKGTVSTYGAVAATAGLPRRARFVSFALNAAPADLALPWHRVVAAGGRIALPAGSASYREQCRRLAREGVRVVRGRAPLPAAPDAATLDALLWGSPR